MLGVEGTHDGLDRSDIIEFHSLEMTKENNKSEKILCFLNFSNRFEDPFIIVNIFISESNEQVFAWLLSQLSWFLSLLRIQLDS